EVLRDLAVTHRGSEHEAGLAKGISLGHRVVEGLVHPPSSVAARRARSRRAPAFLGRPESLAEAHAIPTVGGVRSTRMRRGRAAGYHRATGARCVAGAARWMVAEEGSGWSRGTVGSRTSE